MKVSVGMDFETMESSHTYGENKSGTITVGSCCGFSKVKQNYHRSQHSMYIPQNTFEPKDIHYVHSTIQNSQKLEIIKMSISAHG